MYFVTKVGTRAKNPKNNKVKKCFGLIPILSIYFNVSPVWIKIKLFGIKPTLQQDYRKMLHPKSICRASPPGAKLGLRTNSGLEESTSRIACTIANYVDEHSPSR